MIDRIITAAGSAAIAGFICWRISHKRISKLEEIKKSNEGTINDLQEKNKTLNTSSNNYRGLLEINKTAINGLNKLIDCDMIADLDKLGEEEFTKCLDIINASKKNINYILTACKDNDALSEELINEYCDTIIKDVTAACDEIKMIIDTYDGDNDDDDDETDDHEVIGVQMDIDYEDEEDEDSDYVTIYPKSVILPCLNGPVKVYNIDADGIQYNVANSDEEENIYCVDAQAIPELYADLKNSAMHQHRAHHINEIDSGSFEDIYEDVEFCVYLANIKDEDTMIIADWRIGNIEMGPILIDKNICNPADSRLSDGTVKKFYGIEDVTPSPAETSVAINDDYNFELIEASSIFIVDTIGYDNVSMDRFMKKLDILHSINHDAWSTMYGEYIDILQSIHDLKANNDLSSDSINVITNRLRSLKDTLNKKYGGVIRKHLSNQSDT